jgi:hypothetical protein
LTSIAATNFLTSGSSSTTNMVFMPPLALLRF